MYTAPSLRRASGPRRGLILMVVLALLTAFAIVGLSFVLYADSEAKAAQIARDAEQGLVVNPYDVDPKATLSNFLGQLIFDVNDAASLSDTSFINSSLRGHSLARSMFGYNDGNSASNTTPFNGVGRLHNSLTRAGAPPDEFNMVNYKIFSTDGFWHDPERPGLRTGNNRNPWLCGFNAPYTCADANNMFLAVVDSSGNLIQPSFHRQSIFGTTLNSASPSTDNWTTAPGKYMILRPRPQENAGFGYPEDAGGDVKNLLGNPGGNDSIWLDIASPVRVAPNGKTYKALFAPLIIDLDSRINLSVHGNILGQTTDTNGQATPSHISNAGWGPWSVNIGQVMKDLTGAKAANDPFNLEWSRLFVGSGSQTARYGTDKLPGNNGTTGIFPAAGAGAAFTVPFLKSPYYSAFAFDEGVLSGTFRTPTTALSNANSLAVTTGYFPQFPGGYGVDVTSSLTRHPLAYNTFAPSTGSDDSGFNLGDMESLLRFNDTTSSSLSSTLLNLCPDVFAQQRARNLVTLRSFDVDAPGVSPWLTTRSDTSQTFTLGAFPTIPLTATGPVAAPRPMAASLASNFPPLSTITTAAAGNVNDFSGDGRMSFKLPTASTTLVKQLAQRLDLHRPLPDYPVPDPTSGQISDTVGFNAAQTARQMFAQDIFDRLRLITGADDPTLVTVGSTAQDALRWLGQLAVNIVDFIDNDDYMTPFNWNPQNPSDFVYGTELPRLLINEVFVQFKPPVAPATTPTFVDVWVELFNPLNTASVTTNYLTEGGKARLFNTTSNTDCYQLLLCNHDTAGLLRQNNNGTGDVTSLIIATGQPTPPSTPGTAQCVTGTTNNMIGSTTLTTLAPNSFLLVGPSPVPPSAAVDSTIKIMTYSSANTTASPPPPAAPTVVLRRLACPHMQQSATNPFVTIDYFEDACNSGVQSTGPTGGVQLLTQNQNDSSHMARVSVGRVNPFMGNRIPTTNQAQQTNAALNPVQHTFKSANVGAATTVPWLVHLDRNLSSPMELLHVSGFHPHELTQQFDDPTNSSDANAKVLGVFGHRVPWFDEDMTTTPTNSHRLYRFFEMVETRNRMAGAGAAQFTLSNFTAAAGASTITLPPVFAGNGALCQVQTGDVLAVFAADGTVKEDIRLGAPTATANTFSVTFIQTYKNQNLTLLHTGTGGRASGKINLNTIQSADSEILMALADPSSNNFNAGDISSLSTSLQSAFQLSSSVPLQPFLGNAQGLYASPDAQYPNNSGITRTMFRPNPTNIAVGLFEPTTGAGTSKHPYQRYELLNKIFNNTTSRSNVFAVWLTVGFFECDASGNNLGAEIGRSEGKSIRHRMFAIVDRTGLAVPRAATVLASQSNLNTNVMTVNSTTGINAGTQLLVGNSGSTLELVTVASISGNQIVTGSAFTQTHVQGEAVLIAPGNWGPQPGFDVTQPVNAQIVPYYSIIE